MERDEELGTGRWDELEWCERTIDQRMFHPKLTCSQERMLKWGHVWAQPQVSGPGGRREAQVNCGQVKDISPLPRLISGLKQFSHSLRRQRMGIWGTCVWSCHG